MYQWSSGDGCYTVWLLTKFIGWDVTEGHDKKLVRVSPKQNSAFASENRWRQRSCYQKSRWFVANRWVHSGSCALLPCVIFPPSIPSIVLIIQWWLLSSIFISGLEKMVFDSSTCCNTISHLGDWSALNRCRADKTGGASYAAGKWHTSKE